MRAVLVLALVLLAWPAHAQVLSPDDAEARAAAGELTIVDVRLPMEWAETGLPAGAKGVSLQDPATFQPRPGFVDDVLRAVGGDPDQPIALICATGQRSAFAQQLLARAGFSQVENINEGMLGGPNGPGWLARRLPTQPCPSC